MLLTDGRVARIDSLDLYASHEPVYNFLIADNHTYAVSAAGVVVHNNPCAGKRETGSYTNHHESGMTYDGKGGQKTIADLSPKSRG